MSDQSNGPRQIKPITLNFLADLVRQVRLAWRLVLDPRVSLWVKAVLPASLIYVISPIDFIPDVIPGLGQLDDLAVIVIGIKLFIDLCPPELVRQHLQNLLGETSWQVEPDHPAPSSPGPQIVDAPYEIKGDEHRDG
jgi:uncharacterized membrane protein YkvA (DUF1232 family)